jgi:uncharacterized membrane protein
MSLLSDVSGIAWIEAFLSWFRAHQTLLGWLGLLSVVMFVGSLASLFLILIHLPQNYFVPQRGARPSVLFAEHPAARVLYVIAKNILGVIFVLAGIAMLVLPGQGIISILIGLSFLSLPGKRRMVRRLVLMPSVLHSINRLRRRAGKPPLRNPE